MALDPKTEAAIALHRFGLGPRSGSVNAIASDVRGALLAELDKAQAGRIDGAALMSHGAASRAAFAFQEARRQERAAKGAAPKNAAPNNVAPKNAAPNRPEMADGGSMTETSAPRPTAAGIPPQ